MKILHSAVSLPLHLTRRHVLAAALASLSSILVSCNDNNRKSITLQLGWIPDAHHIGFFAAVMSGLYEARGLAVKILPGGLDTNAVRAVASNAASVGQAGGIEQVIVAVAQGLPILGLAAMQRRSPHALISLSTNPIDKPSSVKGKTIAVAFGDAAEFLFRAFLSANEILSSDLEMVPFRYDLSPLIDGRVSAVTGFITDQPVSLQARGLSPVVLSYSDFGVKSYGYTLITSKRDWLTRRDVLHSFIEASREGWQMAFSDPSTAIAYLLAATKNRTDADLEKQKLLRLKPIMVDADGFLYPWSIENSVAEEVTAFLLKQSQIQNAIEPKQWIAPS